jgi:hypothetical protein
MREATAVIRNARRALRVATGRRGRLHRAINDLDALMGRVPTVSASAGDVDMSWWRVPAVSFLRK